MILLPIGFFQKSILILKISLQKITTDVIFLLDVFRVQAHATNHNRKILFNSLSLLAT